MAFDILCDFDGTISTTDVTDLLLERFAAPGWLEVEALWKAGSIGSRECMALQVALLDCSLAELDAALDSVDIDPGFPGFLRAACKLGASVTVVSDGLDYAIRRILARHDIQGLPVLANRLVTTGPRRFALESPQAREACRVGAGTCKCAVASGNPARPAILVGDGRSDFCVSAEVDLVLAKDALALHCAENGTLHLAFECFAELTPMLPTAMRMLQVAPIEPRAAASEAA